MVIECSRGLLVQILQEALLVNQPTHQLQLALLIIHVSNSNIQTYYTQLLFTIKLSQQKTMNNIATLHNDNFLPFLHFYWDSCKKKFF